MSRFVVDNDDFYKDLIGQTGVVTRFFRLVDSCLVDEASQLAEDRLGGSDWPWSDYNFNPEFAREKNIQRWSESYSSSLIVRGNRLSILFENTSDHGAAVELGRGRGDITARNFPDLTFPQWSEGGEWRRPQRVDHPGFRGKNVMVDVAEDCLNRNYGRLRLDRPVAIEPLD